jgi:hypothetical protein
MLTLAFRIGPGEPSASSRATCFRFCADGTLRGGDNFIAATHTDNGWRLGHHLYREWECAGPVVVMGRRTARSHAVNLGPCERVRTISGKLYDGDVGIGVCLPTWEASAAESWHEVVLLPVTVIP